MKPTDKAIFGMVSESFQGYEAMHMIRKGQVRWLSKNDIAAQVRFIQVILGVTA
jgi:transposase, IS6 family